MNANESHYSHVLYLDLEWTCWNVPPPVGMKPEIIEIGVAEMDMSTLSIIQETAYLYARAAGRLAPSAPS